MEADFYDIMIENLKSPEELLNTPFKDWEHPSLRFDIKEDDEITKHIFFCKTDKQKSFSENTKQDLNKNLQTKTTLSFRPALSLFSCTTFTFSLPLRSQKCTMMIIPALWFH